MRLRSGLLVQGSHSGHVPLGLPLASSFAKLTAKALREGRFATDVAAVSMTSSRGIRGRALRPSPSVWDCRGQSVTV